jgi:DNA-binding FadR family transcriptional regulator
MNRPTLSGAHQGHQSAMAEDLEVGPERGRRLQILAKLRERIVRGQYPQGARLPSEAALAREFKVSRPVVREALASLRGERLTRIRAGSGSYVLETGEDALPLMAPLGSLADLERCFEVRHAVEPRAAALAASRHDAVAATALRAALDRLESLAADGTDDPQADLDFHLAIARAGRNRYFADILLGLERPIVFGMRLIRDFGRQQPRGARRIALEEHKAVALAILARDPERAAESMETHLARTRSRVFEGDLGVVGGR